MNLALSRKYDGTRLRSVRICPIAIGTACQWHFLYPSPSLSKDLFNLNRTFFAIARIQKL
ncbi:hypothetical protein QT972_15610 [Microcoleus sp. herbarium7]|uniref:hypothetical protein n=1 Tax=unclassified Microcoleus TaxID=2642155 RepID=UPI002FD5A44F